MSDVPTSLQCTLCPAKIPVGARYCPVCGTPAPPRPREAAGQPAGPGDPPRTGAGDRAGRSEAAEGIPTPPPPPIEDDIPTREPRAAGGSSRSDAAFRTSAARVEPTAPRSAASWVDAARGGIAGIATFDGRTGRRDFWIFYLCVAVLGFICQLIVEGSLEEQSVSIVVAALVGLATLAASVRRLHDTDRSGYWCLVGLVPFGIFVVFYWLALPSDPGPNRFGRPASP